MKKLLVFVFMLGAVCLRAQDVTGFWESFYDSRHTDPKSVVAVYSHGGQVYGRILIIFAPGSRGAVILDDMYRQSQTAADNVVHVVNGVDVPAKLGGLDILWGMKPGRGRTWLYENGFILNPQDGDDYHARLRIDNRGQLVVRGHLRISSLLGRSQTLERFDAKNFPAGFAAPDYTKFTPDVPVVR